MGLIKAKFNYQIIQISIVRISIISNKVTKPFLYNLKYIKDITNNFRVVNS
jgi:hypothetical protein